MAVQHSPSGSLFPYYYKNGEIHCLKYGSFADDEKSLFARMKAEEDFIFQQGRRLPIWIDLYETRLTNRVLVELIHSLSRLGRQIPKLAIVGCSPWSQWRYRYWKKKSGVEFPFPVQFFQDPEEAKTWLVGEGY